jgi:hypothetical protein
MMVLWLNTVPGEACDMSLLLALLARPAHDANIRDRYFDDARSNQGDLGK